MIRAELGSEQPTMSRSYPYIGSVEIAEKGKIIVVFRHKNTGLCLKHYDPIRVGEYGSGWHEENFMPIEGRVTLSNV